MAARPRSALLLLSALALPALAAAQPAANKIGVRQVWGGGAQAASAYSREFVPAVIGGLESVRINGYEWAGISEGSVYNLARVTEDPLDLAIVQADIAAALKDDPNYAYRVIRDDLGVECAYMGAANAAYDNWGHVLGNSFDIRLATTSEKSGGFGSWQALAGVYPELADVQIQHYANASDAVAAVAAGKADFFFFVQKPTPGEGPFEVVAKAGLHYVPVVDFEMEGLGYDFYDLPVTHSKFSFKLGDLGVKKGQSVDTICTGIALVGGLPERIDEADSRSRRLVEAVAERAAAAPADAFRPDFSRGFLAELVSTSADKVKALADKAKTELDKATR